MKNYLKSRSLPKALILLLPTFTLLLLFLAPMTVRIINDGNILGSLFCTGVIMLWALYPFIKRNKYTRLALRITVGLIIAGFAWAIFLSVNMLIAMSKTPPAEGDYTVIVLGCHVQNGVPSTMLVQRLRTAHSFLQENETVVVTTGGYGIGQPYSEAYVSRNWLVRNDICDSRIFLEDASTSTLENLWFARRIIFDEELPRNIVIVSDGFHLWRAKLIAEDFLQFENVRVIPAKTNPPTLLPTYWAREMLALTDYFFRKLLYESSETTLVSND
jgi:uncharacterized SAM-binding protein YcdF (DUF218 family)